MKRVVILAHRNRGYEIGNLVREIRALGIVVEVCHPLRFSVVMGLTSIIMYDGEPFELPDLLLVRTGSATGSHSNVIISQIERMGCLVINSSASIQITMDKILTMQRLALAGVAIPTTLVQNAKDPVGAWIALSGGEWRDAVAKLPVGSHGAGIQVCFTKDVLKGFGRLVKVMNPKQPILIQNRVDGEGDEISDIRVVCIGGRVKGAMKRIAQPGFHTAGITAGGRGEPYELTPKLVEISEKVCSALGLSIAGVDIIEDKDKNYFCIEGNSAPGFKGFDEYCNANIAREIAHYVGSLLFTKH
ncbi:ATP-grasp domain-containing protein [Bradyrhizobium sp. RDM12]